MFGSLAENAYLCTRKSPKGASLVEESLTQDAFDLLYGARSSVG